MVDFDVFKYSKITCLVFLFQFSSKQQNDDSVKSSSDEKVPEKYLQQVEKDQSVQKRYQKLEIFVQLLF